MSAGTQRETRILVVDDTPSIHDDFAKILTGGSASGTGLSSATRALLGLPEVDVRERPYRLESAFQGEDGCRRAAAALEERAPFHVAIVDMRMPPGINGLETMRRLAELDPDLRLVLCTAYSDVPFDEIEEEFGCSGRVRLIKKPVDPDMLRDMIDELAAEQNEPPGNAGAA